MEEAEAETAAERMEEAVAERMEEAVAAPVASTESMETIYLIEKLLRSWGDTFKATSDSLRNDLVSYPLNCQ